MESLGEQLFTGGDQKVIVVPIRIITCGACRALYPDYLIHDCPVKKLKIAESAIQRVRKLHERYDAIQFGTTICGGCSDIDHGIFADYPCPTIKELDGESND
jgi:hypothetical protein